jgi:hypothetical protein
MKEPTPARQTTKESASDAVPVLRSWATLTTRLLQQGGPAAWSVIDGPLGVDFGRHLQAELADYWERMRPARTTVEGRTESVLRILSAQGWASAGSTTSTTTVEATLFPATTGLAIDAPVRGDLSLFLANPLTATGNDDRPQHPCLSRLVQAVQSKLVTELGPTMEFDIPRTSLQLAEYPGDGVAAYPRHVDRGDDSNEDAMDSRLVTAIYYLTPEDWEATVDGGALRIFSAPSNAKQQTWTDVIPYAHRLIVFRADTVAHAVRPSRRRPRRALTMWWYGRLREQVVDDDEINKIGNPLERLASDRSLRADSVEVVATAISHLAAMAEPASLVVPVPPVDTNGTTMPPSPTIFVSMAAYRDSETGPTLGHLQETAAHPDRVYVGLVLQVDTTADQATVLDGLPTDDPWYRTNVRTVQVPAHQATGPCPARAMAQLLFRGEDYCLQIDAHMRFRAHWDVYLLQELQACPIPSQAILTTYPVGYDLPHRIPCETRGTRLYPSEFDATGMLRQKARLMKTRPSAPVRHSLFAAGFCFGPSAWMRDCPYDGFLHHLFFGEEVSMALRLYTAGYDLYAPRETVVYHLWSRAHRPVAPRIATSLRTASLAKVQSQMRGQGLGSVRTVHDWAKDAGVNLETKKVIKTLPDESDWGADED